LGKSIKKGKTLGSAKTWGTWNSSAELYVQKGEAAKEHRAAGSGADRAEPRGGGPAPPFG